MTEIQKEVTFQGRVILPGDLVGEALVSRFGFNTYACFYNSLSDKAVHAICADSGNKDLFGNRLDGKIICLPNSTGSTSAGAVWLRLAKLGLTPKAMLFARSIDALAAGGLIIADLWADVRIVTIDQLGDELLQSVKSGDTLSIKENGLVNLHPHPRN